MKAAAADKATTKLLGLFNAGNLDGALDRNQLKKGTCPGIPTSPTSSTRRRPHSTFSRETDGFVLMVESGLIDKYSHALDWERAVYDTIMLDNAVGVAKRFAAARNDTLIVVVADHAHPVSIIGTYDDQRPGERLRDKLGIYADARFPTIRRPATTAIRPPSTFPAVLPSCSRASPIIAPRASPISRVLQADRSKRTSRLVANEVFCTPGAARMQGNLPVVQPQGVHSADDVVLTAMGPGAELFRGRIDNTRVFRVIATALGLGSAN